MSSPSPFRNLKKFWHQAIGTKQIKIDGVWISTAKDDLPKRLRSLLFKGGYEGYERELIRRVLRPDSTVLEVGTGIGLISLIARSICKEGKVRSYEANPRLEPLIRKNYALNGLEPDLIMKAISTTAEPIEFFIDDNVLSSSSVDRNLPTKAVSVPSERLDDALEQLKPDTLIMDVEGAETDLLSTSTLSGIKTIIVELHPHIVGEQATEDLKTELTNKGFQLISQEHKVALLQR